jgi:hypothetical protein
MARCVMIAEAVRASALRLLSERDEW